jgi:hypothetical protein
VVVAGSDVGDKPFASFSEYLAPGEGVVAYADGLVRESGVIFDKCKIVLTRFRLIVIKHGWPWGYKVDRSIKRQDCRVLRHKERFDGSQLVIVKHPDGVLCLYFGRSHRGEAEQIRKELGEMPSEEPATSARKSRKAGAAGESH